LKIGFAGLGIMGEAMALNLVKTGFETSVWNRTKNKTTPLTEAGAALAESLNELAKHCDLIITMLNDTPDVEEVILGKYGIQSGLSENKIVVDMSTICADATQSIAHQLQKMGCEMLDAPVSGGDTGAKNGTLTIMAGGKKEVFDRVRTVFEVLGDNIFYCGENGSGQRVKMIDQILCGLHTLALCEAVAISEKLGLDSKLVHKVVSSGAAGSWSLDNWGPRLLKGDLKPGFKLGMQFKDLRNGKNVLNQIPGEFPGADLVYKEFGTAFKKGFGELGVQGLINLYRDSDS